MKTHAPLERIEIIEVIDDDDFAFSHSASTTAVREAPPSSRWTGPIAAVVLIAVVGFGVVTSATDSSVKIPATPGLIDTEFYVADPPPGFIMYLAEARGDGGSSEAHFADVDSSLAQLWATPDASSTNGSWFVVSSGAPHMTGRNSYRQIVDGIEVTIERDPDSRQVRVSFSKNGQEMGITALGWLDRQLLRLVKSVNLDTSVIGFGDAFFASDHRRVRETDPASALFGVPVTRVGYTTGLPTELAESFTVTVSGTVSGEGSADRAQVLRFAMTNVSPFTVGDLPAIVGQSTADQRVMIAQWFDGDRLITISGTLDVRRLVAIAQSVHQSPRGDVRRQLESDTPPVVASLRIKPWTVASGMLADGWPWSIRVSPKNLADPGSGYLWWIGQPGDTTTPIETRPSPPGDEPAIETIVEHGRTYVLASVPRSMPGAELRVNPTGRPSIITPLHDVDSNLPAEFAASVFLEPVTFTARIIDSDGATVASWPNLRAGGA